MTDAIHHPHDKLVKAVMSNLEEAAGFLRLHVPEPLREQIDWQTLRVVDGTYVDEELREKQSDILYFVQTRGDKQPLLIYLLFEHQSRPQKWMRLRLYKYLARIWDDSFGEWPAQEKLPLILPLVFYQGETRWDYSTEFADLLPEVARGWSFVPHFSHVLIDQSDLEPTAVQGGLRARVMQLLMFAAFHEPIGQALRLAAQLLAQLPESGGINYLRVFVHYVYATQERRTVGDFARTVNEFAAERGKQTMSYAEELLREGEIKGKIEGKIEGEIKGKVETIESLLQAGVAWETIEHATGIDPQKFAGMKQELARLAATPFIDPLIPRTTAAN